VNFEFTKPSETISSDFEFKVPLDFLHIASAFDDTAKATMGKLSIALETMLNETDEAPIGENHFFIGPFTRRTPLYRYYVYWFEKKEKEFLSLRPLDKDKDISEWDSVDFRDETLEYADTGMILFDNNSKDSEDTQTLKTEIARRFAWSNHVVANCVRDGKLITVVKHPPSYWSKFKVWLKAKFKRSDAQSEK